MTKHANKAEQFLETHGFSVETVDAEGLLDVFLETMASGLGGDNRSLPMIPAFIGPLEHVPVGKPVIVMDAGGTNLRVAKVTFDAHGKPLIEHYQRYPMPGVANELDAETFFNRLADCLRPLSDASDRIGFCFSFCTEITPNCDGRLLRWTKQVKVPEAVGMMIGENLLARLGASSRHRLTLLNDTVATLLAGMTRGDARRCASYVGFILGTGTNTAYVERNDAIVKRDGLDPSGRQAINVESGDFGRCPRSRFDEAFDARTMDPGAYAFEKMISGAYLGGVGLQILRTAAQEGLFSPPAADYLSSWDDLSTKEMDDFINNPYVDNRFADPALTEADRRMLWRLCAPVTERAAKLAAVNIAAAVIKGGAGDDPLHPVCVNIDGSTYYRTYGLPSRVEEHLRRLMRSRARHCYLVRVEDSPLIGAAVAGLSR